MGRWCMLLNEDAMVGMVAKEVCPYPIQQKNSTNMTYLPFGV